MKMPGIEEGTFNADRHQSKCQHLNLHDCLLEDISVSDLTGGALDALYSLHAKQGTIEQLRCCFYQCLTAKALHGLAASAAIVPLFSEEESEEPPF